MNRASAIKTFGTLIISVSKSAAYFSVLLTFGPICSINWFFCQSATVMYHALELLKTQNTKEHYCESNEYYCIPELWKRHKQCTDLFSHWLTGFNSPQGSNDSEYPQGLKIYIYCNDFNNSIFYINPMIIAYPDITITKSITFQPSLKYVLKSNASPIATILIRASTKKMNVITKLSMSMALFLFVKESRSW